MPVQPVGSTSRAGTINGTGEGRGRTRRAGNAGGACGAARNLAGGGADVLRAAVGLDGLSRKHPVHEQHWERHGNQQTKCFPPPNECDSERTKQITSPVHILTHNQSDILEWTYISTTRACPIVMRHRATRHYGQIHGIPPPNTRHTKLFVARAFKLAVRFLLELVATIYQHIFPSLALAVVARQPLTIGQANGFAGNFASGGFPGHCREKGLREGLHKQHHTPRMNATQVHHFTLSHTKNPCPGKRRDTQQRKEAMNNTKHHGNAEPPLTNTHPPTPTHAHTHAHTHTHRTLRIPKPRHVWFFVLGVWARSDPQHFRLTEFPFIAINIHCDL